VKDTDMDPLLVIEELSFAYDGFPALQRVRLSLEPRCIGAIVGPNGAGKTTILKAVAGLLRPLRGRIIFAGEAIQDLPAWDIVARGVVYVPEGMKVFPQMSVLENLQIGAYLNRGRIEERKRMVFELFPELEARQKVAAGILSGGQQRMVTIARGLMSGARLLLLDDPFLGLSPKCIKRFCDTFRTLRQSGMTLFIAGQHVQRILNVADVAFLIEDGAITLFGPGPEILHCHHLRHVLFGADR
jgi:branched-chain amino acid transport system ATP-binding protein